MSVEMRRLVFSRDELVSAALEYCHRERIAAPDTDIETVELTNGVNPSLTVLFRVASPLEQDRVEISGRSLISAMDGFCERHSIPLPRGIQKQLGSVNGELAMFYRANHNPRFSSAA
ncbi:MAG: hypothetical protein HQ514_01085 [Rhodospirillales bacterium]|nr:hypothetical protein [Rhodospirillales bacterium]